MKFIKHLAQDIILCVCLLFCVIDTPFQKYFENVISFYGIYLLCLGTLFLCAYKEMGKCLQSRPDYKPRSKLYSYYAVITSIVEIFIPAMLGWYWVAVGFLISYLGYVMMRSEADKLFNEGA